MDKGGHLHHRLGRTALKADCNDPITHSAKY